MIVSILCFYKLILRLFDIYLKFDIEEFEWLEKLPFNILNSKKNFFDISDTILINPLLSWII